MVRRREAPSRTMRPQTGLHPSRRGCAAPQDEGKDLASIDMTATSTDTIAAASAPLEKQPLETYVPPAKPSLIGLSRAEIADRLGEIGVAPAQRKMRTQQLWHWMYFRGAKSFAEMTNVSKEMRAELEQHFTVDRPEVVAE